MSQRPYHSLAFPRDSSPVVAGYLDQLGATADAKEGHKPTKQKKGR